MTDKILVTGGAGFIGSNFVRHVLAHDQHAHIVNLDLLTYAGSMRNLDELPDASRHTFVHGDIADGGVVSDIVRQHEITRIVHFAAESHVDRSIHGPAAFMHTNILGTFTLLEAARAAWQGRDGGYRFLHVSTDEVYGSLGTEDDPFCETSPYAPNSPYSASKASSDHLVRAYFATYQLPTLVTCCSNNYGPYQHPEKLIPLMLVNALSGASLPIYGDGMQVRDWLFVTDHCEAILQVLRHGRPGQTYNIGGLCEKKNVEVVHAICDLLDELRPRPQGGSYRQQITHVEDRPGHDRRYAIDPGKIMRDLRWRPRESFESGVRRTVRWYLDNAEWIGALKNSRYEDWIALNYASREEWADR